jgi:hypothetical protein
MAKKSVSLILLFFMVAGTTSAKVEKPVRAIILIIDGLHWETLESLSLSHQFSTLEQADLVRLSKAEEGARKHLNFLADPQVWGGWQSAYTWPTLIGSWAHGRERVIYPEAVSIDRASASPFVASQFLYAYKLLGDDRFLETAVHTGELLLAAQDEEGFWPRNFRMTVSGIQPDRFNRNQVKLKDNGQRPEV